MRDYRFDPTPVVLVPGETVRFTILNGGLIDHDFVIGDEAVQRAWHAADAAATPPSLLATAPPASVPPETGGLRVLLGSGQQAVVEYTVPIGQQLALLCHIPGHIEKGMVGAVDLQEHHHQPVSSVACGALRRRDRHGHPRLSKMARHRFSDPHPAAGPAVPDRRTQPRRSSR